MLGPQPRPHHYFFLNVSKWFFNLLEQLDSEQQKHRTEEEEDFSDTLALMYSEVDPVPFQIDSRSHEESLAASATAWVQSNMVKLSQHFGVDLKGCKRETILC
ncbi:hypothetical protein KY290_013502 [Solanum tuberosum]|uniref:Uncharacterized protein n=1 Tax=Solanum tuberosum TaxID=4113 RepID=A0ABQ7VLV4_SOLTU|nr:hypothetical protein KY289_013618 [Solanum tuberosum]KAH0716934.1 hypothetical protein KY285_012965 [Solanum tuberosum]KAH0769521.1 hypothetical protein KY290_013502 [Solanum tuberosum]